MASQGGGEVGCKRRLIVMATVVLFVAMTAAHDSFAKRMMDISQNLEKALSSVLQNSEIKYSNANINVTYNSSTAFHPKGMAHLYNLTNMFMDIIQKKEAYPEGFLEVHDGHIEVVTDLATDWHILVAHYAGVLVVIILAVLFALLLPVVGFCFCCCRCAGNCGGRSQPFDKKHDKCRKFVLASLLICVTTVFMLGLVCTFVTNERMESATHELPDAARTGLRDTTIFLHSTHVQVHTLLDTNYRELQQSLLNMLQTGGVTVSDQLAEFSRAVSVTTLNTMVDDLGTVQNNLINMQRVTKQLRINASQLDDGLRSVKRELLYTLKNCEHQQCREILEKYHIGELQASGIDFSSLPDVSQLLTNVSSLVDGNIQQEVKEGQKVFDNIKQSIQTSVDQQIPVLKSAIENAGKEIMHFSGRLDTVLNHANQEIRSSAYPAVDRMQEYLEQYAIYRWYVGLALACTLLVILTCVVMGLLCGICGKRPDGYGDDCCNKGAGSKFLMFGVALMYLLGIVLIAITLAYFVIGVIVQRSVCDPLKNPHDDQLFKLMDKFVNLEHILFKGKANYNKDINMSYVISSCHQNKTVYEVLRLDKLVDLQQLKNESEQEVNKKIKAVYEKISFDRRKFVILKASAKEKLRELADSGLSDFPFDRFTEVLVTNITSIDLISLARKLRETADKISSRHDYSSVRDFSNVTANLRNQALHLETYQHNLVNPMVRETEMLNTTAIELRDGLKFNHPSFREAITFLVEETEDAETYLTEQGPEALKNLTRAFASGIGVQVSGYLERVVQHAHKEVGLCGPMSNVYNATLTATCQKILLPWNGFWLASGFCILLFIPLIILSVKLATLYQKSDPYPGPLVEASQHVEKASGRRRGGRESSGGGGGGSRRPRSGDASPRAPADPTRYTDMAPKHWEDFPAGGPPRYHGPAEYERPPPYYYPGPHNERT